MLSWDFECFTFRRLFLSDIIVDNVDDKLSFSTINHDDSVNIDDPSIIRIGGQSASDRCGSSRVDECGRCREQHSAIAVHGLGA